MRLKRAFTLVEMLVVIAIIGILAALVTPALYQAMWSARQTKIKTELDQLVSAVEAFKAKYGSYPPANLTCSGGVANAGLTAFVAKAFPRYQITSPNSLAQQIATDLGNAGVDTTKLNPQRALFFWLGGFNPDVTQPFFCWDHPLTPSTPPYNYVLRSGALFSFDQTRLIDVNTNQPALFAGTLASTPLPTLPGAAVYNAPYGSAAYAYLDYQSYGITPTAAQTYSTITTTGPVFMSTAANTNSLLGTSTSMALTNGNGYLTPYFGDNNNNGTIDLGEQFLKPQGFQLISAGQDGTFGTTQNTGTVSYKFFRLFAGGVGYDPASSDDDNVTNFTEKNCLDAAKP